MPADKSSDWRIRFERLAEFLGITICYLAVAKLSLAVASIHPSASPIWPPTGFALASVLLLGYRVVPAILLGAFLTNVITAGSVYTSLAIAAGNALECFVAAWLINRWSGGVHTFDSPIGVARFAVICSLPSTMISATLGVGSLALAGFAQWRNFWSIWTTWWLGDLTGALLLTPVIVLWARRHARSIRLQDLLPSAVLFLAAVVIGLVAFSPLIEQTPPRASLAFLAILPLIWAALRFDQRDTATTALILASFAVWGTMANGGPFVQARLNDSFLLLLAFIISISVPSLALSADAAMRRSHEAHLAFVMRELSHRSKNLLSVVQGIARQVSRRTHSFHDFETAFTSRLQAFAETHDLLVRGDWRGADMTDLVRAQLASFCDLDKGRLTLEGPPLRLNARAAEQIGLALHELATNAAKYGAFSGESGVVNIAWKLASDDFGTEHLTLRWNESGGPPVQPPERIGFGRLIVTDIVPKSLEGQASIEFRPNSVNWVLTVPAAHVLAK
jgi:two-component sensor histidine kinase